MLQKLRRAIAFRWRAICRFYHRPVALIGLAFTAISVVSTLAYEFGSSRVQEFVRLGNHLPRLSPWVVATIVLTVVLLIGLEGAAHEFYSPDGEKWILLAPKVVGQSIELDVTNQAMRAAEFTAIVTAVEPAPDPRYRRDWAILWAGSRAEREHIDAESSRTLVLGHGEVARRENDGELAGSVAFQTIGADIPFNYNDTAAFESREPITLTVEVRRIDPRASVVAKLVVRLIYDSVTDTALPEISRLS